VACAAVTPGRGPSPGLPIAVLIGLAVPELAVALYFGIAVYAMVPFREVVRVVRH